MRDGSQQLRSSLSLVWSQSSALKQQNPTINSLRLWHFICNARCYKALPDHWRGWGSPAHPVIPCLHTTWVMVFSLHNTMHYAAIVLLAMNSNLEICEQRCRRQHTYSKSQWTVVLLTRSDALAASVCFRAAWLQSCTTKLGLHSNCCCSRWIWRALMTSSARLDQRCPWQPIFRAVNHDMLCIWKLNTQLQKDTDLPDSSFQKAWS